MRTPRPATRRQLQAAAISLTLACTAAAAEPAHYPVGKDPRALAAADIAGASPGQPPDGYPDLAVANTGDGAVSILLNRGTDDDGQWRGFAEPATIDLTRINPHARPAEVAFANIISAGRNPLPDLIVTSPQSREVYIFINNINRPGEFHLHWVHNFASIPGGEDFRPRGLYAADFDNDGHTDLALASESSDRLVILFNDGMGMLDYRLFIDARQAIERAGPELAPGLEAALRRARPEHEQTPETGAEPDADHPDLNPVRTLRIDLTRNGKDDTVTVSRTGPDSPGAINVLINKPTEN